MTIQNAIDPVCKMSVNPATAAGSFSHEGTDYFFCNIRCKEKFSAEPENFLKVETITPVFFGKSPKPQTLEEPHLDPVCNMLVEPSQAQAIHEHHGTTYYFCAKRCQEKFAASPDKYLHPGEYEAEPVIPGAKYSCPMDPEIVNDGPASCPKCGMALEPMIPTLNSGVNPELAMMSKRFWICLVLTVPIFTSSMMDMLPINPLHHMLPEAVISWLQLALSTPVVLWGGRPFFARARDSVINRSPNMFTLVALGTGVAYGYSLVVTLSPIELPRTFLMENGFPYVYFEAAAVITTLVLLGQVLELKARERTSDAIRQLLSLSPTVARKVTSCDTDIEVELASVRKGDDLRVRPGEKIPLDGVVIEGSSTVDESAMTGEADPIIRTVGDSVIGGTLNGTGSFVMRVERVGQDTILNQIVRMVAEAQRTKAPIQRLADRVSAYFVPAVITIAILTFIVWASIGDEPRLAHALLNSIAVLIIACPCALGLVTPMSLTVATGRGAKSGILVRKPEALESLEKIQTLVLDKTGTLTEGKPSLVKLMPAAGFTETDVLRIAASLEKSSEHSLARAVLEGASSKGVTPQAVTEFQAIAGKGISGYIDGEFVALGSAIFMSDLAVNLDGKESDADTFRQLGHTVIFVCSEKRLAGMLSIADQIKPGVKEVLQRLRDVEKLKIVMLTGDNRSTALAVANQLGIIDVEAEVLPADKADCIKRLKEAGQIVAMAGDGINDAPALATADVGIAMGNGTDVAIESAGIVLLRGDLSGIIRARKLSRAMVTNIKQNLLLAFGYNALAVPIAAGVLYPVFGLLLSPMIASAAMSLSSVSVIANALRLRTQPLD